MEASRGRRGKQGRWQLTLGIKDAVFAGLGLAGLMMMAFALGALAGRGDIYRVFYNWGLLAPDTSARAAGQWSPPQPAVPVPPAPVATAAAAAAAPGAAVGTPAPVTGSIVPTSTTPAASTSKKSKGGAAAAREQKAREDEMRRVRQEVAKKLKFQNSFDTAPKARASQKGKPAKEKAAAATKTSPAPVKVAQFRDAKAAKAKLAELKKKGEKVTLKEGKDAKGALYTVYKQAPAAPKEGERVAQKTAPAAAKKSKTRAE